MKVLLFSAQWPEYMIELANALAELEETHLMLPTNHRFTPRHRELISSKVRFIPYRIISHQSRRQGLPLAILILFHIWRIRPDILHIQSNGGYPFLWVFKFLPRKTKVVNTIHDPVLHIGDKPSLKAHNQRLVDMAIQYTDHYIVHGEFLKKQLAESYKVSTDRISVIPHGHFEIYKKFTSKPLPKEEPLSVLFFGRIWRYKGLQHYIDAANLVIDNLPEARFYIVGTGDDLSTYQFDENKKDHFIIVNERVSLEEATYYYAKSAFVVLPYLDATQSGIIPVAYAFSKPVIATRVGAIPEVILEGKTGFLVEPNDVKALAERMELLLREKKMRIEMGKASYKFALDILGWDRIGSVVLAVYKKFDN